MQATFVQDLINSYKLLLDDKFLVVQSENATEDDLKSFHSSAYVDFLKKMNEKNIDQIDEEYELSEFGLSYDCPLLEKNYELIKCLAGSSLSAAKLLCANKCQVVINWFGGWHHAQRFHQSLFIIISLYVSYFRDSAEGFCYVNDIVIAIQKLSHTFQKVLYVDIDIHHGKICLRISEVNK